MAKVVELKASEGKFRLVIKEVDSGHVHHLKDEEDQALVLDFANRYNRERLFPNNPIYLVYDERGNQLADEEKIKQHL